MKILVAIESYNPDLLQKNTLRWAPRAGFNMRIFLKSRKDKAKYMAMIDHLNYDEYLDLQYAMLIVAKDPAKWAKRHGFDLILYLPDYLKSWNKTRNRDLMIIEYAQDIGGARVNLANALKGQVSHFSNGAILEKL